MKTENQPMLRAKASMNVKNAFACVLIAVVAGNSISSAQTKKPSYDEARWDPIHFKPAIDNATNEQCLSCHSEVLNRKVRKVSPAGVKASDVLAWYQTLDTYTGAQETFHARHLTTPFAKKVMNLKCNFCHQGNDLREEAPGSHANNQNDKGYTLRKMVDTSTTCLMCHGKFPVEYMEGLEAPWHEARKDLEDEETPNGCLSCHEDSYRTVRHQVTYLNPKAIEEEGAKGSDSCYGCHGGRQWYRISYPYPRTPWPGMEDIVETTPEWAKNRPVQSDARYRRTK
jgi:hypothetical protein